MKQLRGLIFCLQLLYLVLLFIQQLVRSPREGRNRVYNRNKQKGRCQKDLSSQGPRTSMILRLGAYRVVVKYRGRIKVVLVLRNMEEREREFRYVEGNMNIDLEGERVSVYVGTILESYDDPD